MKSLDELDANRIARELLAGVRRARAQVGNWVANDRRPIKSELLGLAVNLRAVEENALAEIAKLPEVVREE